MFGLLDLLGHLMNVLYVVASSFKKMLYLRSTLIIAAAIEIYYYWNIREEPLWTDIFWSIILIAVNGWWVSILVYEKLTLNLEPDEKKMLQITFNKMNPIHFKKLLKLGERKTIEKDERIVHFDTHIDKLMLIVHGIVLVHKNEDVIAYLREGSFIGEMSFLSGGTTSADVDTLEETEIIIWDKEELKKFLRKNEQIMSELNDVFSEDLIRKLVVE